MTGFDLIGAVRGARPWLAVQLRRLGFELAVALFDRIAKGSALDDRQRRLLLEEFEEGLDDQIDEQELTDHGVLASVGSVGDAYDNAMAESFVDTFKTELLVGRVWRSRSQLELSVVEYVSWFNHERLHESLGDRSPLEFESLYARPGIWISLSR
jgi:putative transposase